METSIQNQILHVAEIEISYHPKIKPSNRPKIGESGSAYEILLQTWNSGSIELQEEFKVMFLNQGMRVLGILEMSKGGCTATVADQRIIFAAALKANATGVIFSHNHPSGNLKPSEADKIITDKFKKIGELLDIKVIDHLIVTKEGYYSFADNGLL